MIRPAADVNDVPNNSARVRKVELRGAIDGAPLVCPTSEVVVRVPGVHPHFLHVVAENKEVDDPSFGVFNLSDYPSGKIAWRKNGV